MSKTADNRVGNFLRRIPQPAYVVADGQKLLVPTTGNRWRELGASIAALEPSKLVAHDKDGTALRAITLYESDSDSKASGAELDSSDPLVSFAKLLAQGYEKSSTQYAPLLDSAMNMIARLSERLAHTEAELDRQRKAYARLLEEIARERADAITASAQSGEGDVMTDAISAIASGVLARQQEQQRAPALANGNGKRSAANG